MSKDNEPSIFDSIDFTEEILSSSEVSNVNKPTKKDLEREKAKLEREILLEEYTKTKTRLYSYLKHKMFSDKQSWEIPSLLPESEGGARNNEAFDQYLPLFDIYHIVKSTIRNLNKVEFHDIIPFVSKTLHLSYYNNCIMFRRGGLHNRLLKRLDKSDKGNTKKKYEKGFSSYFLVDGGKSLGKRIDGELEKGKVLRELTDFGVIKLTKDKIIPILTDKPIEPNTEELDYLQNFFSPNMENLITFNEKGIEVIRITKKGLTKGIWINKRLENLINWFVKNNRFTNLKILDSTKSTKAKQVFKSISNYKDFAIYCIANYNCELSAEFCKHPRK